ncbi:GNAT family N-acetyltransferase [Nocardioides anomalus]|uniref:GNAT family N-acetyltransferase n=1 Tax=Nocardioides anomalus TaxID=2712223 RepID=A0A6G6WFM8_9ACTN|nr:GNAT family N-acetyltransferase [Nocardioides anomalus]QIG43850.1 GNAT family N-acetyltransferase [Nocardioides anomalus]
MTLVPFAADCAPLVVGWCGASPYSAEWVPVGRTAPEVVAGWLDDPDISGHLLLGEDSVPVAYGEVWLEPDGDEAELAHLVVDPALCGRGLGAHVGRALAATVPPERAVFLRVHPDNVVAQACYRSIGFARVAAEDEAAWNAGQPTAYWWMRLDDAQRSR